ncbi:MAG: O-antigen ligase family protein [Proteobacteria bacterium]|nr:O-antigen ligase family protein [Pseudomonadota bacterium]
MGPLKTIKILVYTALFIVPLAFFHPAYNSIKGLILLFLVLLCCLVFALKGPAFRRADDLRISPFIFFTLTGLVSILGTSHWRQGLEACSLEFAFLGFYLVAGRALAERDAGGRAAFLAIIPAGIVAGIGILQWSGVLPVPLDRYGREDLASLFGLSNYASDYLTVIAPLAFWGLFLGNRKKIPALLVTFLIVIYVIFSQNRTAWVALGLSFSICAVFFLSKVISGKISWKWSDSRVWGTLAIISGILLIMIFTRPGAAVVSRIGSVSHFQEASIAYRLNLWESCLKLFQKHPVRGVGIGGLENSVPTVWNRDLENMAVSAGLATQKAHNYYLQVLAERGLPGALGLFWLLFSVGYFLWRRFRSAENAEEFFWLLGIAGGLLAGLIGSVFGFVLQSPASGMVFWLLAALLSRGQAREDDLKPGLFSRIMIWVFVVFCGLLLWQYARYVAGGTFELRGLEAVIRNQKDQALREYDRALRAYPYLPISLERRAQIHLESGGGVESVADDLRKSLEILPHQVGTRELLSQVLARRGQYPEAASELEQALGLLKSPEQRRRILPRLTGFYLLGGDLPRARGRGREAVELNPDDPTGQFYFGLANLFSGKLEPGRAGLEAAVRLDPNSAWSWYYLGSLYFQSGQEEEGRTAWQRSQALDSGMKKYLDRDHPRTPDWLSLK